MEKLQFKRTINAPVQKVWDLMLGKESYKEWTEVFNPEGGSFFEGSWEKGSQVEFIGPDEHEKRSGMYALIEENRPGEFLSIRHLGEIKNGEKQPFPEEVAPNGIHENYTFREVDGKTELTVDLDTNEEWKAMFEGMWPKALDKLQEMAEK